MVPPILPLASDLGVSRAIEALRAGEIIAYPTDTLYGVGGDARSPVAAERVFVAKRRDQAKGVPILLAAESEVDALAAEWPPAARALAAAFWPGALTIAVPARPGLPGLVTLAGTVALRVPGLPALRSVIHGSGVPLIGTSANQSGAPAALTAEEAAEALGDSVALVLDGGRIATDLGAKPSTIVAVQDGRVRVLRAGAIDSDALRRVLGAHLLTERAP
jgi:L-threonylcarbamoyladenylate synthase